MGKSLDWEDMRGGRGRVARGEVMPDECHPRDGGRREHFGLVSERCRTIKRSLTLRGGEVGTLWTDR